MILLWYYYDDYYDLECKHNKHKTAFRARKVTGDFEKQAPEQKLKESQIKKGSIAAIIHFLIRFADGRSLPRVKSSRSRMLCNTFQRRKLKERKEKILKDTKDGPGIQRESFGNSTDSEVLFVIASSVSSLPFNSA